jgi:hypothetical protein
MRDRQFFAHTCTSLLEFIQLFLLFFYTRLLCQYLALLLFQSAPFLCELSEFRYGIVYHVFVFHREEYYKMS